MRQSDLISLEIGLIPKSKYHRIIALKSARHTMGIQCTGYVERTVCHVMDFSAANLALDGP